MILISFETLIPIGSFIETRRCALKRWVKDKTSYGSYGISAGRLLLHGSEDITSVITELQHCPNGTSFVIKYQVSYIFHIFCNKLDISICFLSNQKFLIWAAFHLLLHAKVISRNERSLLLYNCCNCYYLIYGTHKSLCSPKCCCPRTKCGFSAAWALLFSARCRSPASGDLISASEDCCGLDVSCFVF